MIRNHLKYGRQPNSGGQPNARRHPDLGSQRRRHPDLGSQPLKNILIASLMLGICLGAQDPAQDPPAKSSGTYEPPRVVLEGPLYHTVEFQRQRDMGIDFTFNTVTAVRPVAARVGIQVGWFIAKINGEDVSHLYNNAGHAELYARFRSLVQGDGPFRVTFGKKNPYKRPRVVHEGPLQHTVEFQGGVGIGNRYNTVTSVRPLAARVGIQVGWFIGKINGEDVSHLDHSTAAHAELRARLRSLMDGGEYFTMTFGKTPVQWYHDGRPFPADVNARVEECYTDWHFNGSRGGAKPNLRFQMDISGMMRYYSIDFGDIHPVGPRRITRWGPRYARRPRPGQGLRPIVEDARSDCAATYASSEGNNRYRNAADDLESRAEGQGPDGYEY